jgi:putative ABC transport system permease protein
MTVLDIRVVLRGLRRAPGFVVATVAALGIGIGGSTLIFSVVDTLLLRPVPYADPERLVTIDPPVVDWAILDQLRTSDAFEAVGAYTERAANLTSEGESERALVAKVTETYLVTLGIRPALGRAFVAAEYHTGTAPVVLLTDGFWRRHYGGSPGTVGRTLTLAHTPSLASCRRRSGPWGNSRRATMRHSTGGWRPSCRSRAETSSRATTPAVTARLAA